MANKDTRTQITTRVTPQTPTETGLDDATKRNYRIHTRVHENEIAKERCATPPFPHVTRAIKVY